MENMYVQFVKKQSVHGVVIMKTLQTLQISFAIIVFQINTIKDIELKRSITRDLKELRHDLRMCRIFACFVDFLNCQPYWI